MADKKKVKLFIPPDASVQDDNGVFISVNGRNYVIPRGVSVEVPPEVAYEFNRSQEALVTFYRNSASKEQKKPQP